MDNAKVSEEGEVSEVRAMMFNYQRPGDFLDRLKYWQLRKAWKLLRWWLTVNHTTIMRTQQPIS